MRKLILLLSLFFSVHSFGQFFYNFEDNSINGWIQSESNHWAVTNVSPINGSYSLQHNYDATETDTDKIALFLNNIDLTKGSVTWKFRLRHGYSPSGTNRWIVFIATDNSVGEMYPGGTINGYAVGVNYNTTDDILRLYRIDNGSATEIINTGINWETQIGTSLAPGIIITRSSIGHWEFFIDLSGGFDNPVFAGQADDNNYTSANYFGVYYQFTSAQDRKLWLDDITIATPQYDADGALTNGPDTEPSSISSVINSSPGLEVIDFTIEDKGGDNLPTKIYSLTLTKGSSDNIGNWQNAIAGAVLENSSMPAPVYGLITENTIKFNVNNIAVIDNNSSQDYKVKIWLKKDLSAVGDNSIFQTVLQSQNIITDTTGSSLAGSTINYGTITIDITASQLSIVDYPPVIKPDIDFPITVEATDINGNTDTDFTGDITLSVSNASSTISSASGLTQSLTSGVVHWSDLKYPALDTFNITATTSGLPQATSKDIICNSYIYFVKDDFEDGDISDWEQNFPGHWAASSENPIEGNFSLKETFDNTESAIEWITHQVTNAVLSDTLQWRALIKYENQTPSGSNNWNMLLMSDANPATDNETTINGYILGINFASTDDNLTLWKAENGTYTALLVTSFNWETDMDANNTLALLVDRLPDGTWEISTSTDGNFDNVTSLGTATDNSLTQASYIGFRYEYSSTLDRKLTIDNVYFGEPIPDTTPPQVDTLMATTPQKITIIYSEKVDSVSATDTNNYLLDNSFKPSSVSFNSNQKEVELTFSGSFDDGQEHTLKISNIKDLSNNTINETTKTFTYIPLKIVGFDFPDENTIVLIFNRELNSSNITETGNYLIDNSFNPATASLSSSNSITLTFSNIFVSGTEHTITLSNIEDLYGNQPNPLTYNFTFFVPGKYDIIFNELMVDVYPAPNGLPANKYIELHNRTGNDINLSGWTLQIGSYSPVTIPELSIKAGGYAIICSTEAENYFKLLAPCSPVLNEAYLTTTGKILILKNSKGKTIDSISYSNQWYNDPDKDAGGWSLEKIDPDNNCNQDINWKASQSYTGGTPGFVNSVLGHTEDTEKPVLTSFEIISSKDINLKFSEAPSVSSVQNQLNYILNNNSTPLYMNIDQEDNTVIKLFFPSGFVAGENTIKISGISDNCGNSINDTTISFTYNPIHPTDVEPLNDYQLRVYFSEKIDATTASNTGNYTVSDLGNPVSAYADPNDGSTVFLTFGNSFIKDKNYTISLSNITDIYNNPINDTSLNFVYHEIKPFDIVINELMLDVSPAPQGIPDAQYIELYNRTNFDIWLTGWTLEKEDAQLANFPAIKISANSYLIVCDQDYENAFSALGKTAGILTSSLDQTEGTLILKTTNNIYCDYLTYNKTWYKDETKDNGGWSLEKINPDNLCENSFNWTATTDATGGTPGRQNSVFDTQNIDNTLPEIEKLQIEDAKTLSVTFSKFMELNKMADTNYYEIKPVGKPENTNILNFKAVNLTSKELFTDNQKYTLIINDLPDNCGNTTGQLQIDFVYYKIHVTDIYPVDSRQIMLKFSETPDATSATDVANYLLDGKLNPSFAIVSQADPKVVFLGFDTDFSAQVTHTLDVTGVKDKYQRVMSPQNLDFVYYVPGKNDVTINEVLFNPLPNGSDFVEIYNNSEYPVYLRDLGLSRYTQDSVLDDIKLLADDFSVINPGEYIAVCADTTVTKDNYFTTGKRFIQITLPSMPDDEGNVVLLFKDSIIDYMFYEEQMQSRLLADPEGVSLEKINPRLVSSDKNNWHSAAQSVGFATPATKNSQYNELGDSTNLAEISLSSKTFSPDNDGYEDYLYINYQVSTEDCYATVFITDHNGRIVKHLVQDELVSTNGFWTWDGFDDNSVLAPQGIYIVVVKIFTPDGKKQLYRKAFALVKKVK